MMPLYIKFRNYLDSLPLATRIAFGIFFFFVIYLLWNYNLWQENKADRLKVTTQLNATTLDNQNLQLQLKSLTEQIQLKRTENASKNVVPIPKHGDPTSKLISATNMRNILENLLTNKYKLSLIEFQTLPLKTVPTGQTNTILFEHGIVLKFRGDYFATINYLKAIEELKWHLFWDKLEYKVTKYPFAEVTMQIHTLSDQEGWIHA